MVYLGLFTVETARRGNVKAIYDSLDNLGALPWKVNKEVFEVRKD